MSSAISMYVWKLGQEVSPYDECGVVLYIVAYTFTLQEQLVKSSDKREHSLTPNPDSRRYSPMHLSEARIGRAMVRSASRSQGMISPSRSLTLAMVSLLRRSKYRYNPATSSSGGDGVVNMSSSFLRHVGMNVCS